MTTTRRSQLPPTGPAQLSSINDIDAASWDALDDGGDPFSSHAYLSALENSGCAAAETGWHPAHLILQDASGVCAAAPRYLKDHSWGEFVFDFAWAEAAQQAGIRYFPKAVLAVPFTPVPGPRLRSRGPTDLAALAAALQADSDDGGVATTHVLFPSEHEALQLQQAGALLRTGLRFEWHNRGYAEFEDFLASLRSRRRKEIRRERRHVATAGIHFRTCHGKDLDETQWSRVYDLYAKTYLERGQQPYLNLDFWQRLAAADNSPLRVGLGSKDGQILCCAMFLIGKDCLYGRHWGTATALRGLHFEACYYQGMELCIREGLGRYDAGVQGWHKIHRGFDPVSQFSAHFIAHPALRQAIARWLAQEQRHIDHEHAQFLAMHAGRQD